MRYLPALLLLATIAVPCRAEQMTVDDLYKICTSPGQVEKTACTFYILGVFEGADMIAGTTRDKAGTFRDAKDKPFCLPPNLSSTAMELVVKMKMGEDVAVFPQDREMPAVTLLVAIIAHEFPCKKTK